MVGASFLLTKYLVYARHFRDNGYLLRRYIFYNLYYFCLLKQFHLFTDKLIDFGVKVVFWLLLFGKKAFLVLKVYFYKLFDQYADSYALSQRIFKKNLLMS